MSNRMSTATAETSSCPAASPSVATHGPADQGMQYVAKSPLGRIVWMGQRAISVLGLIALSALGLMFFNPEVADKLKAISPFTESVETASPPAIGQMPVLEPVSAAISQTPDFAGAEARDAEARQQQRVAAWLSRRYRVAADAINVMVSESYRTAQELKLDPLLILSVIAIESRFNPFAESPVGAQGLMQVMSKVHEDKFEELGGVEAALNPMANIYVGSKILKDYVKRSGSVEGGLKLYVGAGTQDTDFGYGAKVLAEYERLKQVANGKKVSVYTTAASATGKPKAVKETTTSTDSETVPAVGLAAPGKMNEAVTAL